MSVAGYEDPAVKSVAVLAAWCDCRGHLYEPSAEQYLSEPARKRLCETVASQWQDPHGHSGQQHLSAAGRQSSGQLRCSRCGVLLEGPQLQQVGAAEQCQRSVDQLLQEYYKMVTADGGGTPKLHLGRPGLLDRAFLLLCPDLPPWLGPRGVARLLGGLLGTAATATAVLSWLLVPLLCWVVRDAVLSGDHLGAARISGASLVWLLLADGVYRGRQQRAAAAAVGRVRAADVASYLGAPAALLTSKDEFLAPAPSTCLLPALDPAARSPKRPSSAAGGFFAPTTNGLPAHTAATGAAAGGGGGGAAVLVGDGAALVPMVQKLKGQVYGTNGVTGASSSGSLVADVQKLCQEVGVSWAPPAGGAVSAAELTKVVVQLQQQLGA